MKVRLAAPSDRVPVVGTVVAAFDRDPAFRYFLGDDDFQRKATAFVEYLFDKRIIHDTVWVTEGGEAAALWSPPDHLFTYEQKSYANALRAEMRERIGVDAVSRLDTYDRAVDAGLPKEPHWYLGVLATHPIRAGRGFGRAVMDAGLAHVRGQGGLAVLETTNPRNPSYYERAGWDLLSTVDCATPSTIWIMKNR